MVGVEAIVEALRRGQIKCRVYRKDKFHAKGYITHAKLQVVGSAALVGSSNFTQPGIMENIELNVQITGGPGDGAPGVVRGSLEGGGGRYAGHPSGDRAPRARVNAVRGVRQGAARDVRRPGPDDQSMGTGTG